MARRSDLSLSRDLIADTALELFRTSGVEALTTRKVATALGASPMSLYVHVGNKEGLIDAIVERIVSAIRIELDGKAPWPAQTEQWAHGLRRQLSAYPGVMGLLQNRRWAFVRSSEPLVRALLGAGLSVDEAVHVTRVLTWSTIGFLLIESGVSEMEQEPAAAANDDVERSLSALEALEGGTQRSVSRSSRSREDIDLLFATQIRLLVDGLRRDYEDIANAAKSRGKRKRPTRT